MRQIVSSVATAAIMASVVITSPAQAQEVQRVEVTEVLCPKTKTSCTLEEIYARYFASKHGRNEPNQADEERAKKFVPRELAGKRYRRGEYL